MESTGTDHVSVLLLGKDRREEKMKQKMMLIGMIMLLITTSLFAITAEEIIKKMEVNLVYNTSIVEGRMVINDRFGSRTSTYISYAEGEDKSLLEFTNKEDAGQKILRLEDEIYLYYPDAEETIRLQGAALRQAVMGSDFSYEDMTGDKGLLGSYNVSLDGEESIDGNFCYIVTLTAKTRDVPYQKEIMWVDKELFIYRQVHKLAKSGKLLKEMKITDVIKVENLYIPSGFTIEDKLKRNSSTEFYMDSIELGVNLPKDIFTLSELW
jgi:outer membrane lipoprotein-sorting protein